MPATKQHIRQIIVDNNLIGVVDTSRDQTHLNHVFLIPGILLISLYPI